MWTKYEIEMRFLTALCASVPADPNLQKKWLESRTPGTIPPNARSIEEIATEVMATTPEVEDIPSLHIFQRMEGGLAMRAATVRAHIKEIARTLSSLYVGKVEGERSFAVRVINAVYLDPQQYWLPILSAESGKPMTEVTGQRDKAIHMNTPKGPRSAIKVYEFVEDAMLRVPLQVLQTRGGKSVISKADLESIFEYGGVHGYAGERGDGEGRYIATIAEMK